MNDYTDTGDKHHHYRCQPVDQHPERQCGRSPLPPRPEGELKRAFGTDVVQGQKREKTGPGGGDDPDQRHAGCQTFPLPTNQRGGQQREERNENGCGHMESPTVSRAKRHREHSDSTIAETEIPVINIVSRSDQT